MDLKQILGTIKVITIKRNYKKQNSIKSFLLDLNYEFIVGLDMTESYKEFPKVSDLPDELFKKYDLDKEYCSRWTKGQLGCFATEKMIISEFHQYGKGNLTIFLDDAIPSKKWKENILNAYSELPTNWDALILGTHLQFETIRFFRLIVYLKRKIKSIFLNKQFSCTRRYSKHLDHARVPIAGIYGIIYSQEGLEKLVNERNKMRQDQDDVLLSRLLNEKYMNIYLCYPQAVREGKFDGSWTQRNDFD